MLGVCRTVGLAFGVSRSMAPGASLLQLHLQLPAHSEARGYAAVATSSPMALIKSLREKSGAPISDVKGCLESCGWDVDAAYDALRKKGLAAAAKKAARHAAEGLVGVAVQPGGASSRGPAVAIVEINSETDFVSRSDVFRSLVRDIAGVASSLRADEAAGSSCALDNAQMLAAKLPSGVSVSDACAEVAAQVRENVRLRRAFVLAAPPGSVVGHYVHMSTSPGLGSIACAVSLSPAGGAQLPHGSTEAEAAMDLAAGLAMHGAGMRPSFVSRAQVPQEALAAERAVLTEQAAGSGKPAAVIAKMVEGRLSKYYEEHCLLDQKYLLDDSVKVQGAVSRLSKQLGVELQVSGFLRVQCGEGLQGTKTDFAEEVSKMMQ